MKGTSTVEAVRDFTAGVLSLTTQTGGCIISAVNIVSSLFQKKKTDTFEKILVTGASSGIGKALVEKFAESGNRIFVLVGRNVEKLDAVARTCTEKGNRVRTFQCDFSQDADLQAFTSFIQEQDTMEHFDLVIANAGMMVHNATSSPQLNREINEKDPVFYNSIVNTNVKGILATFLPLLDRMKERNGGHIVLVSSINAYLGPANQYLYSATKSFIRTLGQDLQVHLRKTNVHVSVVAPGLVDTNMTLPFWESENQDDLSSLPRSAAQDPAKFAGKVYKGIVRGDNFITYPYYQFFQTFLGGTLPPTVRGVASGLFTNTGFAGQRET
jgi:short-subunit dehydrogenase